MSQIFLSHSSRDNPAAVKVRDWLIASGWNDIFLDLDPNRGIAIGQRWLDELRQAGERCAAVIVLVSPDWAGSRWCVTEFLVAQQLGKLIFPIIVAPTPLADLPQELVAHFQLADISAPEIEPEGFERLAIGLRRAGLGAEHFAWPPPGDPHRSPFRGLVALDESDAGIFFGRDALITRGLDALRRMRDGAPERAVVVLGVSGAGKSSYLRAGLLARLRRDDGNFLPLPALRPGRAAISGESGLAAALEQALAAAGTRWSREQCRTAIAAGAVAVAEVFATLRAPVVERHRRVAEAGRLETDAPLSPTVVIAIDQAEELFDADNREAAALVGLLGDLVRLDGDCLVLATLRSNAYGQWQGDERLSALPHTPLDLPILSIAEFKQVIEAPAALARPALIVEPALTERLIEDTGTGDALPLLAFTLEQLSLRFGGSGRLTAADYVDGLGGLQGAIANAAEGAIAAAVADPELPNTREAITQLVGQVFIPGLVAIDEATREPRRRIAVLGDLPAATLPLVRHLVDARLLTATQQDVGGQPVQTVEVAHEAILRQWPALAAMTGQEQDALIRLDSLRRAAGEWDRGGRGEAWLHHRDGRLSDAVALAARPDFQRGLGAATAAYLQACVDLAERAAMAERARLDREIAQIRSRQRFQRLAAGLLVATALLVAAGAAWTVRQAQAQNLHASRILARLSQDWADQRQWDRAARLAMEGVRGFDAPLVGFDPAEARSALIRALGGVRLASVLRGHAGLIAAARFTPDGRQVVTGGADGTTRLWDAASGKQLWSAPGAGDWVLGVSLSRTGGCFATAAENAGARLWDLASGRSLGALTLAGAPVAAVACSPDGRWLATSGEGHTAVVWDLTMRKRLATLSGHQGQVLALAFSADGQRIATGSTDATARIWNAADGRPIATLAGHTGNVSAVAFSPDGARLVTASRDNTARIWDAASGAPLLTLQGDDQAVSSAAFSPDGKWVLTASQDGSTRRWDAATGLEVGRAFGHVGAVNAADWSPDGALMVTAGDDGLAKVMHADGDTVLDTGERIIDAGFMPGGARLLVASADGSAEVWNVSSGKVEARYGAHPAPVLSAALSPDGALVAAGSADRSITLSDTRSGAVVRTLSGADGEVRAVAFTPDGRRLVSASADGTVRLWDVATGQELRRVAVSPGEAISASISPDGRIIASTGQDSAVRLWDATSLAPLRELKGHASFSNSVRFSPDGQRLVTASNDDSAIVWDVASGRALAHLAGHADNVADAEFSPDGTQVVTASGDRSVRIWDAAGGQELYRLERFTAGVRRASFAADGRSILSVGADKLVKITPVASFEDAQLRAGDSEAASGRACAAYLVGGAQGMDAYEQNIVAALTARSVSDVCRPRDSGGWLWAGLAGVAAIIGAGVVWRLRRGTVAGDGGRGRD